jgi:hypothetical protein
MRHWLDDPHRPTRDLDLLGFGDSDPDLTLKVFRCVISSTACREGQKSSRKAMIDD